MVNQIVLFVILFCVFLTIKLKFLKPVPSDTPAGAIIMACGIFINGAMKNIYFLEKYASELLTTMLFLLWIFIMSSFVNSFFKRTAVDIHFKNPIKSFAVGTWVAATSVCGIAVFQRLTWLMGFARLMFFANVFLWLFYIYIIFRGYITIFNRQLLNKVNGVLLISTVGTQSIVVLGNTVFGKSYPVLASRLFIALGLMFYIFAFVLIIKRYFFTNDWSVEDDWQNTNCILHGAMSITGLASVVSKAVNYNLILVIWIWIIIWFAIVEIIELYRGYKRIKKYGFNKGIAVYDVTQWSRIFTFGMFYTFTMRFNLSMSSYSNDLLLSLQNLILKSGTWVMVFILVIESLLFFKSQSIKRAEASN